MAEVLWDKAYPVSEAERAKFVEIDRTTLTDYPSSGRGKWAVVTYNVGSESTSPGASASNPSYVRLVDGNSNLLGDITQVTDTMHGGYVNALNVRITESVTTLSAFQIDATGVSGLDIQASLKYPDTTIYESVTIAPTSMVTIDFGRKVLNVEAFNTDITNPVYISFNSMDLPTLTATAMPMLPEGFYSIDRQTQYVYVANASVSAIDVRVVGHYRNI